MGTQERSQTVFSIALKNEEDIKMHSTRKITDDLIYVGADTRRLALFEGIYKVPHGMAYNSYLLKDEKTVLFDTVDASVSARFFENVTYALDGRSLDYVVVQHMEPDHSATLFDLLLRYPDATVVCNKKTLPMIKQFFGEPKNVKLVDEGDVLDTGKHKITFVMAPMVHWPEVMVSFDLTDGTLFSADAFGSFGATDGAIFADEVDFMRDHLDEARRYYCNIVGKYGTQVESLLAKASALDIKRICPLHGFIWRCGFGEFIEKYKLWASYTPEVSGALILYSTIYGNTENAAISVAMRLRELGIKTEMYDTSMTENSDMVAAAFKYSHAVIAAPTYNAGIFSSMDALLRELPAHGLKKRSFSIIENGTWAISAGKQIAEILAGVKDSVILDKRLSIKSSFGEGYSEELDVFVKEIANYIKAN